MRREAQRELEEDQERTRQLHRQKQNPPNWIYDNATMKAFEERMSERLGRQYTANIINESQPNDAVPTFGVERDFESVVMMRMRQAAERQRLIEQMQKEEDEEKGQKFNKDITKTPIKWKSFTSECHPQIFVLGRQNSPPFDNLLFLMMLC